MLDGVLLIDKPAGPTSHDLVDTVRRLFNQRRVGHTGTLDPQATGLLVMLLGKATRLSQWMVGADKEYEGAVRFGVATETLDSEGRETVRSPCRVEEPDLKRAAENMIGEIDQMPPQYSAIKSGGKPAYSLARKGLEAPLESRRVTIGSFTIDLVESGEFPLAEFVVACSSGTYIRSIAADLGAALGCPAHLAALRRTKVGSFDIKEAFTIDELALLAPEARSGRLLPPGEGIRLPSVTIDPGELPVFATGRAVPVREPESGIAEGATVKINESESGRMLGLGEKRGEQVKPFMVFA